MKLGILADLHARVEPLAVSLAWFRLRGVDQVVTLGDLGQMPSAGEGDAMRTRVAQAAWMLRDADAVGVLGNHDLKLARELATRTDSTSRALAAYLGSLRQRLELDNCLFTHVDPWMADTDDLEDLWWFEGAPDTAEKAWPSFEAADSDILFVGHFHRWLIMTGQGRVDWDTRSPITLDRGQRYLIVIAPAYEGHAAIFDTAALRLEPFQA